MKQKSVLKGHDVQMTILQLVSELYHRLSYSSYADNFDEHK